jgi:hypothetical protein
LTFTEPKSGKAGGHLVTVISPTRARVVLGVQHYGVYDKAVKYLSEGTATEQFLAFRTSSWTGLPINIDARFKEDGSLELQNSDKAPLIIAPDSRCVLAHSGLEYRSVDLMLRGRNEEGLEILPGQYQVNKAGAKVATEEYIRDVIDIMNRETGNIPGMNLGPPGQPLDRHNAKTEHNVANALRSLFTMIETDKEVLFHDQINTEAQLARIALSRHYQAYSLPEKSTKRIPYCQLSRPALRDTVLPFCYRRNGLAVYTVSPTIAMLWNRGGSSTRATPLAEAMAKRGHAHGPWRVETENGIPVVRFHDHNKPMRELTILKTGVWKYDPQNDNVGIITSYGQHLCVDGIISEMGKSLNEPGVVATPWFAIMVVPHSKKDVHSVAFIACEPRLSSIYKRDSANYIYTATGPEDPALVMYQMGTPTYLHSHISVEAKDK